MAYFKTCSLCGATLDPNEKCTCKADEKRAKDEAKMKQMVNFTKSLLESAKNKKRGKRK